MKRPWKIALSVLGVIVGCILIAIGAGSIWVHLQLKGIDVSPSAYEWDKGLSDAEVDALATEVLAKMSLEEKVEQMSGPGMSRMILSGILKGKTLPMYAGYNERLGIPPIAFTDGPKGIRVGNSTSFPVAMARAATWDPELEHRVGDVIGKEARAWGANYFAAPCINLVRHPSMGRAQETYGEDPWLMGEMSVALIEGVQKHNVMACAKHYALNSMETARFAIDVQLDERTLREVYLPHFRKSVEHGVASVMSAYNKVRGEYAGHSKYLLTDILRNDWGFDGFVTSDWFWSLRDGLEGVRAGMDVEMPWTKYYGDNLLDLIDQGQVTENEIDEIVHRIVRTKLRYVTREDPMDYPVDLAACPEHTALAREVAEKSMVLLKNDDQFLPLNKGSISTLAVIGELANADNTGDRGSSLVEPPYLISALAGIEDYLEGSVTVLHADGSDLTEARRVARDADVVIVVAGAREHEEGEYINRDGSKPDGPDEKKPLIIPIGGGSRIVFAGGDRVPLSLNSDDLELIDAVSETTDRFVVTLIGGSAITIEEWKDKAPAILMAWYFGMEGGNALPRILFGDVNPSGKLPFTVPVDESNLPFFDEFADTIEYGPYHGYTLFDKEGYEAAFAFGHGLSYTTFDYSNLEVVNPRVTPDGRLDVRIDITNTGTVTGDEVAQLYIGFPNSQVERPVKLLRGFARITLEPGETRTVDMSVDASDLAWYNPETGSWEIEETSYEVLVGPSSLEDDLLQDQFEVTTPRNRPSYSEPAFDPAT
jgi:beta-glucosidase